MDPNRMLQVSCRRSTQLYRIYNSPSKNIRVEKFAGVPSSGRVSPVIKHQLGSNSLNWRTPYTEDPYGIC